MSSATFQAHLDTFSGPLDLLLYLIKVNEVTIEDLPIVTITEQYLELVDTLKTFDPDGAAEFLVLAATLVEIKSKMLLPREDVDFSEIEDPRSDLVTQLLEYQKLKHRAQLLGESREHRRLKFIRGRQKEMAGEEVEVELGDISTWDLLTYFNKILSETLEDIPTTIAYEEVAIEVHMNHILSALIEAKSSLGFRELVTRLAKDRLQLVGMFIAILELARIDKIRLEQARDFSDIHLVALEGASTEDIEQLMVDAEEALETDESEEEVSFDLDNATDVDGVLNIDRFYKSTYRGDNEVKPENVENINEDDVDHFSMDIDDDMLGVIRTKIADPILNPEADDIASWRAQSDWKPGDEIPEPETETDTPDTAETDTSPESTAPETLES